MQERVACDGKLVAVVLAITMLACSTAFGRDIARWTFDEPSPGGDVFDVDSVNGLKAIAFNHPAAISRAEGALRLDNAKLSDREGAVLLIEDSPLLTNGDDSGGGGPLRSLSIEVDVKLESLGQQMQIVRKTDGDVGYELYITDNGHVGFRIKGSDGTLQRSSKNAIAADGQWHHIAATWCADEATYTGQVRVDEIVTSAAKDIGTLTDTDAPLIIGGLYRNEHDLGQRFSGLIDNVVISSERFDLMHKSGRIDPTPVKSTGQHLLNQPGFVSAQWIAEPPPTPECHAGTIAQASDGSLMAAWFGGTYEGHVDVGIWQSRFENGRWSSPQEVADGVQPDGSRTSTFNPVLFQYPDAGPMLLFYMDGTLEGANGNLKTSTDGGRTWSPAQRLPDGIRGAVKNQPVLLADGTLICPDNHRELVFYRTSDQCRSWLETSLAPNGGLSAIQPAVLVHSDGKLQALARSHTGSIVTTWSQNNGATWSPLEKTDLPNNFSGIGATTLKDGRFVLVYNHSSIPEGKWGGPRTPLNVAVSEDGIHWQAAVVLEDESGEYSYPSVIQSDDGMVHVIYTWKRIRMKHAVLDPSKFQLRPIVNGQWPR
ncbi:MAG: exo-alpha-sialidase [Phycisphaeraceae bacterium]|nr:exo-alpha-sialidase [Phycisphaeraceae bacterium]